MLRPIALFALVALLWLAAAGCTSASPTATAAPPAPTETTVPTPTAVLTPAPTATATPKPTPEPAATPSPTPAPTGPQVEWDGCDLNTPPGVKVECGWLAVPENRKKADSQEIYLRVAVFKATQPVAQERVPVVYLAGGPGGNAIESVVLSYQEGFSDFAVERDLIVFDQRGTGMSDPALDCPEVDDKSREVFTGKLDSVEAERQQAQALKSCMERLADEGWDLAAYNSAENAADVEGLRIALGHEKWDLWGISYGTRLALTVIRDFPGGVRTAILDSTYPLEVNLFASTTANALAAFDRLWRMCDAHPVCQENYPGLEVKFIDTVAKLNALPAPLVVTDPTTGQELEGTLDGGGLAGLVFQAMYSAELLPVIPEMIYDAAQGDYWSFRKLTEIALAQSDYISVGMNTAVQCVDELAFTTAAELDAAEAAVATRAGTYGIKANLSSAESLSVCDLLGRFDTPAKENMPVSNANIPTLVLAGQFDPITPPEWGQQVTALMSRGVFAPVSTAGHGVTIASGRCPRNLVFSFLRNPIVNFVGRCDGPHDLVPVPPPAGETVMAPFQSSDRAYRGLAPAGWRLQDVGVLIWTRPGLGDTGLIQVVASTSNSSFMLGVMALQLGLPDVPAAKATRQANGSSWTIYESAPYAGQTIDMASADVPGGGLLFVALISPPSEAKHDALYERVFLPAINALEPIR